MLVGSVQHCTREKFQRLRTVFKLYIALRDTTVSTIICKDGEVRVLDSLFTNWDKETEAIICGLYQCDTDNITIIMRRCQKQASGKDYGLCALAFTVALVFNKHPSILKFNQQKIRSHLMLQCMFHKTRDDTLSMQTQVKLINYLLLLYF